VISYSGFPLGEETIDTAASGYVLGEPQSLKEEGISLRALGMISRNIKSKHSSETSFFPFCSQKLL
jgi:hypothetical protein